MNNCVQEKAAPPDLRGNAKIGAAWVVLGFGAGQFLRLGSNIVLAALLYEEVFALMGIVTTLMIGLGLLSDVGLKPSVVQHPRGDEQGFLNTVWTLQILRGLLLYLVLLILTVPVTNFYGANDPAAYELYWLIPLIGTMLVIDGLQSSRVLTAERHLQQARINQIEIVVQISLAVLMIGLAWYLRSVYAIAISVVVCAVLRMLLTYLMLPGKRSRIGWERSTVKDVFHFGKWIFVSTCLTYLTVYADKLLISGFFPLAEVGVFFLAVNLAMLVGVLISKIQQSVIFPWYSRMMQQGITLPSAFQKTRLVTLIAVTYLVTILVVGAAPFFELAYDTRYARAATYLPVLAFGAWFSCLAGMYNVAFLAIGKSGWSATTSVSKLIVLGLLFPLILILDGDLLDVTLVVVFGDIVRAAVSQGLGHNRGLLKFNTDIAMLSFLIFCSAVGYLLINHVDFISVLHPIMKLAVCGFATTLLFTPLFIKFVFPFFKRNLYPDVAESSIQTQV